MTITANPAAPAATLRAVPLICPPHAAGAAQRPFGHRACSYKITMPERADSGKIRSVNGPGAGRYIDQLNTAAALCY
jgi:hypothetical protein